MAGTRRRIRRSHRDDVVIVPAFGAPTGFMRKVEEAGCYVVDTTCGDVMKVWRRVRGYAKDGVTSIIHGKANRTRKPAPPPRARSARTATATTSSCSRSRMWISSAITSVAAATARHSSSASRGSLLAGFRSRPASQQRRRRQPDDHAQERDRGNPAPHPPGRARPRWRTPPRFHFFDTICGATQERQDALFDMLKKPMDVLLVVGGYNSSNTAHLVEIAEPEVPTFFIRGASCIRSLRGNRALRSAPQGGDRLARHRTG